MQISAAPDWLGADVARCEEAARRYHGILQDPNGSLGRAERRTGFEQRLREVGLQYGQRLLANTLRPHFITRRMADYVEEVMTRLYGALNRLARLSLTSSEMQQHVGMTPLESELAAIHPRSPDMSVLARMDAFLGPQGLHLVEMNGECPTGVGYNERLFRAYDELDAMQRFRDSQICTATDGVPDLLEALLLTYRAWGGVQMPRVAIVDWNTVVTRGEFEILAEHFRLHGVETDLVDPRELELHFGRLMAKGKKIDLVYRRLLTTEMLERREECHILEQAYRSQAACFVNSLRTKFLHKKLSFSLFWEPRFEALLSADELRLGRQHVPWTVRVAPQGPLPTGERGNLLEYARHHQSELVLKPNDDYGGRGLLLGAQASAIEWEAALLQGVQSCEDPSRLMVLQQRIPLYQADFATFDGDVERFYVDLDPFFFQDRLFGYLTRVSGQAISNVTTGGGQIPTYILED